MKVQNRTRQWKKNGSAGKKNYETAYLQRSSPCPWMNQYDGQEDIEKTIGNLKHTQIIVTGWYKSKTLKRCTAYWEADKSRLWGFCSYTPNS